MLKKYQAERDQTSNAHREFLASESLANSFPQREKDLLEATVRVGNLNKETEVSLKKLNEVEQKYDRERHQTEKAALLNLKTSEAESKAKFDFAKKTQTNLQSEIERLQKIRQEMQAEFAEKERLEKINEATKFIRDTLKEAAPRVARNYVFTFPQRQISFIGRLRETPSGL
ncbi:MAG: hypothetical protein HC846_12965 [Blastocatellia bacterium]|nr:hypothetical protein [Blastocatellia bacterium]